MNANEYAIDQELLSVADAVADAREHLRKGDIEQVLAAIEDATGLLGGVETVLYEDMTAAELDEAESPPSPSEEKKT